MRTSLALVALFMCGDAVVPLVNGQDTVPYSGITRTNKDNPYHGYARNLSDPQQTLAFCEKVFRWKSSPVVDVSFINCVVPDEAAQLLCDSNCRRLFLSKCELSTEGLQQVLSSQHLVYVDIFKAPSVERLDLSVFSDAKSRMAGITIHFSKIDDETLLTLGEINRTFSIHLSNAGITGRGFTGLRGVPNLLDLNLCGNPLDDDGLSKLPQLPKLILLDFSGSKITDAGLAQLSPMPELTQLNLSNTAITGKELRAFAESKQIFRVDIKGTKLTDEGMAKLPTWPALKEIDLSGTMITDDGLRQFRGTDKLRYVMVSRTSVSEAAMSEFSKSWPEVLIGNVRVDNSGVEFQGGVRRSWVAKPR